MTVDVDVPVIGVCMCVWLRGGGGGGTVNAWSMTSVTTEMLARANLSFELSRKIKWTPNEKQVRLNKNVDIVQVFICKPRLVVLSISYIILHSSHCEKLQCHLAKRKEKKYISTFWLPSLSSSGRSHIVGWLFISEAQHIFIWWRNVHSRLPHMPALSFMTSHTGCMNS